MYLRPDDLRFMTGAGLVPTRSMTSPPNPTSEAVRQARQKPSSPHLRRWTGKLLLKAARALLRSARQAQRPQAKTSSCNGFGQASVCR